MGGARDDNGEEGEEGGGIGGLLPLLRARRRGGAAGDDAAGRRHGSWGEEAINLKAVARACRNILAYARRLRPAMGIRTLFARCNWVGEAIVDATSSTAELQRWCSAQV